MHGGDHRATFIQSEPSEGRSHRNLPHRDQAGAPTSVTFWRADSMPKQVVAKWHKDIEQWLQQNKGGK